MRPSQEVLWGRGTKAFILEELMPKFQGNKDDFREQGTQILGNMGITEFISGEQGIGTLPLRGPHVCNINCVYKSRGDNLFS